ncbi:MAG: secondary thiamine-phosphate synthase enzyme YjbQ [Blastocatellia bacterium]|jgi:secondary thiamine-phosphate synthase enzyme
MNNNTEWIQREFSLAARRRGFHIITREILDHLPEIGQFEIGLLHLFIQHTSASLTINENADPDVRGDLERHFNHTVPENAPYYEHTLEGPDDMPAHIKSTILGNSLTIPIGRGSLRLGTWQGIYLCEHRNQNSGLRRIVATISGRLAKGRQIE